MIFAANLKCNHTRSSFSEYANIIEDAFLCDDIYIFPPSPAFLIGNFSFKQGAQNFYPAKNGSFTGEIGTDMLDEFKISSVLIGHSERRNLGEKAEILKQKFDFAKSRNYKILYCIGEDLSTLKNGKRDEFLKSQLDIIDLKYPNLIIAYEPIWAIGTGESASFTQIAETLGFLSNFTEAPLLYGGSVNAKNIAQILSIKDCSGVLVGTASWDAKSFINLIKNCDFN